VGCSLAGGKEVRIGSRQLTSLQCQG